MAKKNYDQQDRIYNLFNMTVIVSRAGVRGTKKGQKQTFF